MKVDIDKLQTVYNANVIKKIGDLIYCPTCGSVFVKKTKKHSFCSNGRTKKKGNCKDKYWNMVDERRRKWQEKDFDYVDGHRNLKKLDYI